MLYVQYFFNILDQFELNQPNYIAIFLLQLKTKVQTQNRNP